jgi:hypothetical protein
VKINLICFEPSDIRDIQLIERALEALPMRKILHAPF